MKGKQLIVRIFLVITILGTFALFLLFFNSVSTEKFSIYVRPNSTYSDVKGQFDQHAGLSSQLIFSILNTIYGYEKSMHEGCYEIKPGISTWKAFHRLYKGRQTPIRLTFNNIRTKEQLAGRFATQLMIDSTTFAKAFSDKDSCAKWGFTPETITAMFIPDTYEMYWNLSLDKFMKKMKSEYDHFWSADRKAKADSMKLSPIEVAIMASIVEEESNNKLERPAIAGLYYNRLRIGMPLQADPTVKFAVNDFKLRRILFEHLKVDSPYNTYKNTGLPPGPIRIPSASGIDAVLNYQKHEYIYMCANWDFSGRHAFARTMQEHHRNAQKYRQELDKRKIK